MSDFERYGDYNEVDETPTKSPVLTFIKIIAIVLSFSVVGLLGLRMFTFSYYPAGIKKLHFNSALSEFYLENNGDIGAKTQRLRAPYDNADEGNFFCDNLIIIPKLGQLQISLRYNVSLLDKLTQELGSVDAEAEDFLTFRLWKNGESKNPEEQVVGSLTAKKTDSFLMYRYYKLVFDGIDFEAEGEKKIEWLRLEIFVKGQEGNEPYSKVAVYENNEGYSSFSDYNLSNEERP